MARPRSFQITETPLAISRLEHQATSDRVRRSLRSLRLLKEQPGLTLYDVADQAGVSIRTMSRIVREYRVGGIDAILRHAGESHGRPTALPPSLRETLKFRHFANWAALSSWLHEQTSVELSRRQIGRLLGTLGLEARLVVAPTDATCRSAPDLPSEEQWILDFMKRLSHTATTLEWVQLFRVTLMKVLHGIDRISVDINVRWGQTTSLPRANLRIRQHLKQGDTPSSSVIVSDSLSSDEQEGQLLAEMREAGFPMDLYHPPTIFLYRDGDGSHIGSILLWTLLTNPKLPTSTLHTLQSFEPLILFLFRDCAARHQAARPLNTVFYRSLDALAQSAGLTQQEQRIITYRLLGLAYKEIADVLRVRQDTIAKHIRAIHQKTATSSITELYAKYFTPRL